MIQLFDTHCHLDDPRVDLDACLTAMRDRQVVGAIIAGYGPERHARGRQVCAASPKIRRAVGLHPWWLSAQTNSDSIDQGWRDVAAECREADVVAFGEIGLDRTRKQLADADQQRAWLRVGLRHANAAALPVILHVVGWYGHALTELRAQPPIAGGVIHRFGGPTDLVPPLVELGLFLSLDGIAWRRDPAALLGRAAAIPLERLVVETDWPEPDVTYADSLAEMSEMSAAIASHLELSAAEFSDQMLANAARLYGPCGPSGPPPPANAMNAK